MRVRVNGEWITVPEKITLKKLIEILDVHMHAMAIAVNENVIPKKQWESYILHDEDRVEIIRVVAGGQEHI